MPNRTSHAVVEMLQGIMLGKTEGVSRVDYFPQKTPFPADTPYEQPFRRSTPEAEGVSSEMLIHLLRELNDSKTLDMHQFLMVRHGKVICQTGFAPYDPSIWHHTYSMCKSITGMAIGMLVEEGLLSLDENIYTIFSDETNLMTKMFRPAVTVEHLLTMTSGVQFNETGIVSGNDWLRGFLEASVNGKPGTVFEYNSMNTYVLSCIVTKKTGLTLEEYLRPRLFAPMGITKYLWEKCPRGFTKGGWGLFLCPEDMAKLGQLYLQKGKWNGEQLVSEFWVEVSTAIHMDTESVPDTYGYGYQLWMEARPGSFEYNGMLGQNVIVYPDLDLVLVTCAGNRELFQICEMLQILRKYISVDLELPDTLPENRLAYLRLTQTIAEITDGKKPVKSSLRGGWKNRQRKNPAVQVSTMEVENALAGRYFEMQAQNVGIFPLVLQVMHNHLTKGIRKIGFTKDKDHFYMEFLEGDTWVKLPIGFGKAKTGEITLEEETYLTATSGTFRMDNDVLCLSLDICFLEEALRRKIELRIDDEQMTVHWNETPGTELILNGLKSLTEELEHHIIFVALKDHGEIDLLYRLMEDTIEPVVRGVRCERENPPEEAGAIEGGDEDDISGDSGERER